VLLIALEVRCTECGKKLEAVYLETGGIEVEPCGGCLDEAGREGYGEGYEEGVNAKEA
jgi:hypothetical protein